MSKEKSVLEHLSPEKLEGPQLKLYNTIINGPRAKGMFKKILIRDDGSLAGPFDPWLRSPLIGKSLEQIGLNLRLDSDLSEIEREIAILVVAAAWKVDFEWKAHSATARRAGLDNNLIEDIRNNKNPKFTDPKHKVVYEIAHSLVYKRELPEILADKGLDLLGERGLVEVALNIGFYFIVSITLESFKPLDPLIDIPEILPKIVGEENEG